MTREQNVTPQSEKMNKADNAPSRRIHFTIIQLCRYENALSGYLFNERHAMLAPNGRLS
jgi:hypothetical protein